MVSHCGCNLHFPKGQGCQVSSNGLIGHLYIFLEICIQILWESILCSELSSLEQCLSVSFGDGLVTFVKYYKMEMKEKPDIQNTSPFCCC